jgi:hypothetical protein
MAERLLVEESIVGSVERRIREITVAGWLPGQCWLEEVPEETYGDLFPNATLHYPKTDFQYSMEGLQTERPFLTLKVYAKKAADAEKTLRRIVNGLMDSELDLTAAESLQIFPADLGVMQAPRRGPGGVRLFESFAELHVWITGKQV